MMRRRTMWLLLLATMVVVFVAGYFQVDKRIMRAFDFTPDSPRIKQAGNGIVIELPDEEDD